MGCQNVANIDIGALPNLGEAPIEMMPPDINPKYASGLQKI